MMYQLSKVKVMLLFCTTVNFVCKIVLEHQCYVMRLEDRLAGHNSGILVDCCLDSEVR